MASDDIFICADIDFSLDDVSSIELDFDGSAVEDSLKTVIDLDDFDLVDDIFDRIALQGLWKEKLARVKDPVPVGLLVVGRNGTSSNIGIADLSGKHFRRIPITNQAIAAAQLDDTTQ